MESKKAKPFVPYEGKNPYIFVSYSHKDSHRVLPILTEMNQRGYRVWYDEGIPWTSEWPAVIEEHLHNCGVCLAFHSRASMESDHCRREIHYALQENKPILSAYLENIQLRHGLGLQLSLYQSVKLSAFPQIDDFVTGLEQESTFSMCREEREVSNEKDELNQVGSGDNRKVSLSNENGKKNEPKPPIMGWLLRVLPFFLAVLCLGAIIWVTLPPPPECHASEHYGEWSEWSTSSPPPAPLGCTIEEETISVEDVPAYEEYRYGRWLGATSNWCKEYGESLHGGIYSIQETEWSTVRAVDTNTHWLCGHFDSDHPSHINASTFDSRGYPMWTKYIVDGYSDPEFYWEETRLIEAVSHTEYRWRTVYYDYTVYFSANGGEVSLTEITVTNGEHYEKLPTPQRENYSFVGWFTKPYGGKHITDESTVNLSECQTLYAHWKYNPST